MAPLPSWMAWLLASQVQPRSYQLAFLLAGLLAVPSFLPLFLMSDDRPERIEAGEGDEASKVQQSRVSVAERLRAFIARLRYLHWRKVLLNPVSVLVIVQVLIGLD